jgi:hypothetical protein
MHMRRIPQALDTAQRPRGGSDGVLRAVLAVGGRDAHTRRLERALITMQMRSHRAVARLAVLAAGVAVALIATTAAPAVTPTSAPLPPATQVTINNGAGNQTDPHVSGDIATYTTDVAGTTQTQVRCCRIPIAGRSRSRRDRTAISGSPRSAATASDASRPRARSASSR